MSSASPPIRLQAGTRLATHAGHSVVVRGWRGEGSYARVYQGDYSRTGTRCALKAAKPEIAEAAARLESERLALAALQHPRLVALLDWGACGTSLPYLVLEWLEGETLLDYVARPGRLALRRALEILEAVCEGLAFVHGRGRTHGDIRPQNILIVPERGAVLTDPGARPDLSPREVAIEDIRAVGSLLEFMLTGEFAVDADSRLTRAGGYSRAVVELWEQTRSASWVPAADLLAQVRRLRQSL